MQILPNSVMISN